MRSRGHMTAILGMALAGALSGGDIAGTIASEMYEPPRKPRPQPIQPAPHQGEREMARRRRQMERAALKTSSTQKEST